MKTVLEVLQAEIKRTGVEIEGIQNSDPFWLQGEGFIRGLRYAITVIETEMEESDER